MADVSDDPVSFYNGGILIKSLEQHIAYRHIIGAQQVDGACVSVWYVSVIEHRYPNRARHKIHRTPAFKCCSERSATELVEHLRGQCCWRLDGERIPQLTAIVNPVSGKGRGEQDFSSTVLPMLQQAAGLQVTVVQTTRSGHATEVAAQLELGSTDMLLCVGGDGTLWEALQGLLTRPDWQQASKLPIAHIPCGSGNGVATTCGILDPTTAAYAICKGRAEPLDVVAVEQGSSRHYLTSMLTYGLLSNLITDTQHLRFLGELRLTVGAVREIVRGTGYSCRLAYLPAQPEAQPAQLAADGQASAAGKVAAHAASEVLCCSTSQCHTNPMLLHARSRILLILNTLLQAAGGASDTQQPASGTAAAAAGAAGPKPSATGSTSSSAAPSEIPLPILASLGGAAPADISSPSDLPPGWKHLDLSGMQIFCVANIPWIAQSYHFSPHGAMASGCVDFVHSSRQLSRLAGLRVLLSASKGRHLEVDGVHSIAMRALVLEPLSSGTAVALDGEVVGSERLYLEVLPGLCRAVVSPDWQQ